MLNLKGLLGEGFRFSILSSEESPLPCKCLPTFSLGNYLTPRIYEPFFFRPLEIQLYLLPVQWSPYSAVFAQVAGQVLLHGGFPDLPRHSPIDSFFGKILLYASYQ